VSGRQLDPVAAGRVLRRASGLFGDRPDSLTNAWGVSEQALLEAAAEVGMPVDAVRRALAVERLDPRPRRRASDRLIGAAIVTVDAEVTGSAPDVLARLDDWFVEGHHLRRHRLRDGRGEWIKRPGIVGRTVRTVRVAFGEGGLGRVRRVRVTTSETGTGTTVVRVEVDRRHDRRLAAAGGAAVATAATAGTVAVAVAAMVPVLLVAAPLGLVAGLGVAGGGRSQANVIAGEVDRVLDAVDERTAPTRLRTDVTRRVTGRTRRSLA
jgi:hypothetical protein